MCFKYFNLLFIFYSVLWVEHKHFALITVIIDSLDVYLDAK